MASRDTALAVIRKLQAGGYEAFLVGGCVRDIILGREPKDFDVTTSALPDQVQGLFEKTLPVGVSFGVVIVVVNGEQIEVATYRADGAYTDGRRPDTVEFGKTAKEDVERRDFTMNGLLLTTPMDFAVKGVTRENMGMYDGYGIVDFVGGQEDINDKVIRCIGDPNKRFEEDALRMLRAVRFAAQLGFEIEQKTMEAIEYNAYRLKDISRERVAAELFRMFSSPEPLKALVPFITTGLFKYALPEEFPAHANMVRMIQRFGMFEANKDPMLGMAMFFTDVQSHADMRLARYLKLSNEQAEQLVYMNSLLLVFNRHLTGVDAMSEAGLKRACRQPGLEYALEIMTMDEVMGKTKHGLEAVMGFVLKLKAYKPEDLRPVPLVTGNDLIDMGIPPGPIFSTILYDVETGQLEGIFDRAKAFEFVRARVYQDENKEWVYDSIRTIDDTPSLWVGTP